MTELKRLLNWKSTEDALAGALRESTVGEALRLLAMGKPFLLVRNWFGQLTVLLPCTREALERSECGSFFDDLKTIAGPLALTPWVLCVDELFEADAYWSDPSLLRLDPTHAPSDPLALMLLERQDKENDWLTPVSAANTSSNPTKSAKRTVFFSIKGGVGRSTALVMLAITLATKGKRVLVVDGDFESPGLSSSVLPRGEGQPAYGVVDWLTAQALGADSATLQGMARSQVVEASPLNATLGLQGQILVAPAYGRETQTYVSKLARIYRRSSDGMSYATRLNQFLEMVEGEHKIDVTLFDSRAGIDDTAAVAITQLRADVSFLFAVNTRQTWDSYGLLFEHLRRNLNLFWKTLPESGSNETELQNEWDLRRSLRLVSALTPQASQAETYLSDMRYSAYDVFNDIYDDASDDPARSFAEPFAPAPDTPDAPHYPIAIMAIDDLRAFDPLRKPSQLTDALNQAAFVDFVRASSELLN